MGTGLFQGIHRPNRAPAVSGRSQHGQVVHGITEDHVFLLPDPVCFTEILYCASLIDIALIEIHKHQSGRGNGKSIFKILQISVVKMGIRPIRIHDTQLRDRDTQGLHILHSLNIDTDSPDHVQISPVFAFRKRFRPGINVPGLLPASGKIQDPGDFLPASDGHRQKRFFPFHDHTPVGAQVGQSLPDLRKQISEAGIRSSACQDHADSQIQKPCDHLSHFRRRHRSSFRKKRSVDVSHYHLDHKLSLYLYTVDRSVRT